MKTKKTLAAETGLAPDAVEVAAPLVSSEENGTVSPSRMRGSFLTVDSVMDASPITFKFRAKNTLTGEIEEGLVFEDIVDSSGESGARKTPIPLKYLTKTMRFTLVVWYEGTVNGKIAVSLPKDVGINFYSYEQGKVLAPRLLHEKIHQNTPKYYMHDHEGDEIVKIPLPDLAQEGDKLYCSVVIEQFSQKPAFYIVAYDYALTADDIASGENLSFPIARGWLARQKPLYESITCQAAWITSGLPAQPPAEVQNPDEETRLPRNALEIPHRRTADFIGDQGLQNLPPPHLSQSTQYNNTWCLNPELTKEGGDVGAPGLDTYAGDQICFYVSGSNYDKKSLGCVSIEHDGDQPSVKLPACVVACFFHQSMTLTYTVQFPNSDEPQESPKREISVSVPEFTFSDIEEVTAEKLDLSTFQGNANATVPAWAYAECSSTCWMWLTGKREDGSDHRFDILVGAPVTDEWKRQGVRTSVSRQGLKTLADCSKFELHFAVSFCDANDFDHACKFAVQTFDIEQEPLKLVAPTVTEAIGSELTAWNGADGVHIEVAYDAINPNHRISVCWERPGGTCWELASRPGSTEGAVSFALPPEAVIESLGKTVRITYTVITACKVQTSPTLNLKISLPTRLEAPNVNEATPRRTQGATLDLRTFTGNANSLQDGRSANGQMWFLRAGQKCWLRVTGTGKNGSPYSFVVYEGRTITEREVTEGVASPVLRSELEKLNNNTSVSLTFSVATDGSLNENVVCPSRELKVRLPFDDLTTFDDNNWNHWEKGPAAVDSRDLVIKQEDGNWFLYNWTYTNNSAGVFLKRDYSGLEVGFDYKFSISIRRVNGVPAVPQVSLLVGGRTLVGPALISSQSWQSMSGIFTATGTTMSLELYNHVATGIGNDYAIDNIRVTELLLALP